MTPPPPPQLQYASQLPLRTPYSHSTCTPPASPALSHQFQDIMIDRWQCSAKIFILRGPADPVN